MPAHLADMQFGLAPEPTSGTHEPEAQLLGSIRSENDRRRAAIRLRKEAEKAKEEAKLERLEKESRWAKRQEEKQRYTDQQRQWWDTELALSQWSSTAKGNKDGTSPHSARELLMRSRTENIDKEQKAFAHVEQLIREAGERQQQGWDKDWKDRRAQDALAMRAEQREKKELLRQQHEEFNRQAKDRLAHDTRIAKQTEEVLVDTRFRAGEYLRRQQELVREEKTKELEFSHETDYAYQTEMFKRDEKSRATHKEARAIKAKSRLDEGRLRQKMIEDERKATEKAAKEKALENKRAFHELQRLKAAEKALAAEQLSREAAEKAAAAAEQDAQRAIRQAQATTYRDRVAKTELSSMKTPSKSSTARTPTSNRTVYEAKKRAAYGTGAGSTFMTIKGEADLATLSPP